MADRIKVCLVCHALFFDHSLSNRKAVCYDPRCARIAGRVYRWYYRRGKGRTWTSSYLRRQYEYAEASAASVPDPPFPVLEGIDYE